METTVANKLQRNQAMISFVFTWILFWGCQNSCIQAVSRGDGAIIVIAL